MKCDRPLGIGAPVSLDFRAHPPEIAIGALGEAGFAVIDEIHREPCDGAEYPRRRCHVLARAV
jgi:hypothetical protein